MEDRWVSSILVQCPKGRDGRRPGLDCHREMLCLRKGLGAECVQGVGPELGEVGWGYVKGGIIVGRRKWGNQRSGS